MNSISSPYRAVSPSLNPLCVIFHLTISRPESQSVSLSATSRAVSMAAVVPVAEQVAFRHKDPTNWNRTTCQKGGNNHTLWISLSGRTATAAPWDERRRTGAGVGHIGGGDRTLADADRDCDDACENGSSHESQRFRWREMHRGPCS